MANDARTSESHNSKFRGWWIPAEIVQLYEDQKINAKELILLAKIDSLVDVKLGVGCFASNQWLADAIHVANAETVRRMIVKFKRLGLVTEIDYEAGRRRYLETAWSRVRRVRQKLNPL